MYFYAIKRWTVNLISYWWGESLLETPSLLIEQMNSQLSLERPAALEVEILVESLKQKQVELQGLNQQVLGHLSVPGDINLDLLGSEEYDQKLTRALVFGRDFLRRNDHSSQGSSVVAKSLTRKKNCRTHPFPIKCFFLPEDRAQGLHVQHSPFVVCWWENG